MRRIAYGAAFLAAFALAGCVGKPDDKSPARYAAGQPVRGAAAAVAPPEGKVFPRGFAAFAVTADAPVFLRLDPAAASPAGGAGRVRVALALDHRAENRLQVFLPRTGRILGHLDVRYGYPFQPFELPLNALDAADALEQGVGLRLVSGPGPLYLLAAHPDPQFAPLGPGLVMEQAGADRAAAFRARLASLASLQPFGWMEGCVLDALDALSEQRPGSAEARALAAHLDFYFPGNRLAYFDHLSRPAADDFAGIEFTLPVATLARRRPDHPAIDAAVSFWMRKRDAQGAVTDGPVTSTEGCYTVAWPMAAVAARRNSRELAALAAEQLRLRTKRLVTSEDAVYQQLNATRPEGQRLALRNWSRGVAWYLLGYARVLETLGDRPDLLPPAQLADLRAEFRRRADWAIGLQRRDGLWGTFLDDPASPPDTSGSAGIAAALAFGHRAGLVDARAFASATRAGVALRQRLTPDGLLAGAAQVNKGGPALQRSDYRVITQFGMGLLGQLDAALPGGGRKR